MKGGNHKIEDKTYFWDIETTKITPDNGEEMQITFLSNVLCMNCYTGEIISSEFFRTIEETVFYFETLPNCIVWCHNLDYELYFLLRELGCNALNGENVSIYGTETQEIILRDKNSPLSITLERLPKITFRDSYALFNKSVQALGEELNLDLSSRDDIVVKVIDKNTKEVVSESNKAWGEYIIGDDDKFGRGNLIKPGIYSIEVSKEELYYKIYGFSCDFSAYSCIWNLWNRI